MASLTISSPYIAWKASAPRRSSSDWETEPVTMPMWTLPVSSVEAVSSAGAASSVLVSSVLVSSVLVSSVVVLSVFSVAGAVLLAQATRPSSITRASSKHTTFFIQTSSFEIHIPDWGYVSILPVFFILSTNSCAGFRESVRNQGVLKSCVLQTWAHFSVFP